MIPRVLYFPPVFSEPPPLPTPTPTTQSTAVLPVSRVYALFPREPVFALAHSDPARPHMQCSFFLTAALQGYASNLPGLLSTVLPPPRVEDPT